MSQKAIFQTANKLKEAKKTRGLKYLWCSDLYRYTGKVDVKTAIWAFLRRPGFQFSVFMRICFFLRQGQPGILKKIAFRFFWEILILIGIRYQMLIQPDVKVGPGFYIEHFSGIFINAESIGKNCNITPGVIIGVHNRGSRIGRPTIGDNVFIGPGARIFGKITIGNNVAVGANAVVARDIPDNAVVIGNPAQIISFNGSEGYVNQTDYSNF